MSVIKDLNAITEYRNRRQSRLDQRRDDDEWKTINGTHVMVDDDGQITRGPEKLKSLGNSVLKPSRTDYEYDPSDGFQDFVHKNVEKARPIYEEKGMEGVEDEWYKTRLRESTKDLKEIGDDEIDRILNDNINPETARLWLVEYNNDIKPKLVHELTANKEVRNAALNIMYQNYKTMAGDKALPFKEFMLTPIKMYRGGSGKEYKKASPFSSYTLNKEAAEKFKNGPTGHEAPKDGVVYEAEIRPIDTYGSLNTSGEMEIFVPRMIAPNGRRDSRADEKDWNEELNITSYGIEPTVASARPNKITGVKLSADMKPTREYIFLDSKGKILGHHEWLKANRRALQKLYEQGVDGVDQDYYKGLMVNASRKLKRVPDAEVVVSEDYKRVPSDSFFRQHLIEGILKNKKARNAALNIMYDNYCKAVHGCMTFEEFLNTPIKMNKISDGDVFSSYGFMSDGDELTIRPIDTFGSIRKTPDASVMIPWWRTKGEATRSEEGWSWDKPDHYIFKEKQYAMPESELLDAIKGEAEVIKLFSDDNSETGKAVIERCTDSIHRYLKRLAMRSQEAHTDSAFFSGELNGQLGERNILYPEIGEYQARRKQRLDGKEDDEGQWITTEHGHHVHLNEEGEPDKGNPHVIEKMEDGEQAYSKELEDAARKDIYESKRNASNSARALESAKHEYEYASDWGDRMKKWEDTKAELEKELEEKYEGKSAEYFFQKAEEIKALSKDKPYDSFESRRARNAEHNGYEVKKIKQRLSDLDMLIEREKDAPTAEELSAKQKAYEDAEKLHAENIDAFEKHCEAKRKALAKKFDNISKCKSTADVEDYLYGRGYFGDDYEDTFNENLDLRGIGTRESKTVAKRIDKFMDDYPILKGRKGGINSQLWDKSVFALAHPNGVVSLSRKWWEDPKAMKESWDKSVESGFSVPAPYEGIIDHEFTHEVENAVNEKLKEMGRNERASDIVMKRVVKAKYGDLEGFDDVENLIRAKVSGYAYENKGVKHEGGRAVDGVSGYGRNTEFLAEAVEEARCAKKPREIALLAQQELNKLIKEVFG